MKSGSVGSGDGNVVSSRTFNAFFWYVVFNDALYSTVMSTDKK